MTPQGNLPRILQIINVGSPASAAPQRSGHRRRLSRQLTPTRSPFTRRRLISPDVPEHRSSLTHSKKKELRQPMGFAQAGPGAGIRRAARKLPGWKNLTGLPRGSVVLGWTATRRELDCSLPGAGGKYLLRGCFPRWGLWEMSSA